VLRVFADPAALAREAAKFVAAVGIGSVYTAGRFSLVLAGGRTPLDAYRWLAAEFGHNPRLWARTSLWWGDERCVPPDHHQSNFHGARLSLVMPLGLTEDRVHRIRGEAEDPEAEAAGYAADFPARPDLLLLGVGEDGHVAGLFPGSPLIGERERRFAFVPDAPKPPRRRITLTPAAIASARRVLVLASGAAKAGALRAAFAAEGSPEETPARLVSDVLWMADGEAAGHIGR
jgi:6-phosphogluconolactonase